jgi:2-keto-4-pentenoate hydratase
LLKGKYIIPVEIEMDSKTYYGYKVNLTHPQVQTMVKIAGYKVS